MAGNPLYPGYNPATEGKNRYPGKGMAAKPGSGAMELPFLGLSEGIDATLGTIEHAIIDTPKGVLGYFPSRIIDDVKQQLKINVYPSHVDRDVMDDYAESSQAMPGAYGITIDLVKTNPITFIQDPEKTIKDLAKQFTKNVFNRSDLSNRAVDEFYRRITKDDPGAAAVKQGTEFWDGILKGIVLEDAAMAGVKVAGAVGVNPLTLQSGSAHLTRRQRTYETKKITNEAGKQIDITVEAAIDKETGWRGVGKGRRSVRVADPADATKKWVKIEDVELETEVNALRNLQHAYEDFQYNKETAFFRDGNYIKGMHAAIDVVASDLAYLKNSKTLNDADRNLATGYLYQSHFLNTFTDAGSKYGNVMKGLDKGRTGSAKTVKDALSRRDMEDFARGLNESITVYDQTLEFLRLTNSPRLQDFEALTKGVREHMVHLQGMVGTIDAKGQFHPSTAFSDFLANPTVRKASELHEQLHNHMGIIETAIGTQLWGKGTTVNAGMEFKFAEYMSTILMQTAVDGEKPLLELLQENGLESAKVAYYAKEMHVQRSLYALEEFMNALKKGTLAETYGWTPGLSKMLSAGYYFTHPANIIKYLIMDKTHSFLLVAADSDKFDALINGSKIIPKFLFRHKFTMKLAGGFGGSFSGSKNLSGIGNFGRWARTADGRKAIHLIFVKKESLIKNGEVNMEILKLLKIDAKGKDAEELIKNLQEQIDNFKKWIEKNKDKLGPLDLDKYVEIFSKLSKQNDIAKISREHLGLLEKVTKFGNEIQTWLFTKVKILGKLAKTTGLAKEAVSKALVQVYTKVITKVVSKLSLDVIINAIAQALGTAAPVIGNLIAIVAAWLAKKTIDLITWFYKNTIGRAVNTIKELWKNGELPDIMEDVEKMAEKNMRRAIRFILLLSLGGVILGAFSSLIFGLLSLGPSSVGGLLGSATSLQQTNLTANPFIVMLMTIPDMDPTRQNTGMEQTDYTWDWEAFPRSGIITVPTSTGGAIPGLDGTVYNGTIQEIFALVQAEMGTSTTLVLVECPGSDRCYGDTGIVPGWCRQYTDGIYCIEANLATVSDEYLTRLFRHELTHTRQGANWPGWPAGVWSDNWKIREWGAEHYSQNGGGYCFGTTQGTMRGTQISLYLINTAKCNEGLVNSAALADYDAILDLEATCSVSLFNFITSATFGSSCP